MMFGLLPDFCPALQFAIAIGLFSYAFLQLTKIFETYRGG